MNIVKVNSSGKNLDIIFTQENPTIQSARVSILVFKGMVKSFTNDTISHTEMKRKEIQ